MYKTLKKLSEIFLPQIKILEKPETNWFTYKAFVIFQVPGKVEI